MSIRPLRHSLGSDSLALIEAQRANGGKIAPVHLMLVHELPDREIGEVACRRADSLGEWVTGDSTQVTCPGCLETVHA